MKSSSWKSLGDEVRSIWDQNAAFWDESMGPEGNAFHRHLVAPASEKLLDIRPGEVVLDVACGNGNFSRRLASLGAKVVAFDVSSAMIEKARAYTKPGVSSRIEYHVLDAADHEGMLALGEGRFDAAVSHMALMDMPQIEPLLHALSRLLKPDGRFVFSTAHPCFNSSNLARFAEEEDVGGELVTRYGVKVWSYRRPEAYKGLAIAGQPAAQYYFHRPLSLLFGACFAAGFVLDGLEEPVFEEAVEVREGLSWKLFSEIPPALVARLRPARPRGS